MRVWMHFALDSFLGFDNEYSFFQFLISLEFIVGSLVFLALFFITAPYGRHESRRWGPLINAKFAWMFMESPSFINFVISYFIFGNPDLIARPVHLAFALMFLMHYFNRAFIYPLSLSPSSKPMPISVMFMAWAFCMVNGYIQGRYAGYFATAYPTSWLYDPRFIIGVALFFAGAYINKQSDRILSGLKKKPGDPYVIPKGGLFNYVTSANYFGELVEWAGYAISTWSLPGLCFFFFTFCNLVPRAYSHHKWYRQKFDDYPKTRKAIIPFVF